MLELRGITVRFGSTTAVDDVDLTVEAGQVVALLGPSGSGKTTLLRAVAGLERAATGSISWRGQDLSSVPVHDRPFGMMFQDYALFPHLDVTRNVAFGLEMSGAQAIDDQVHRALELVGLGRLADRRVTELSGGEQQRVAFARTLAPRPELIMLDEPLGALDRELRARLLGEMAGVFRELGQTVLYVTHDQEEAFAVADLVAILDGGRLQQLGAPDEVWASPANETVARFLGFPVLEIDANGTTADTPWGSLPCALPPGRHRAALRPEAVRPGGEVTATIVDRRFEAGTWIALITAGTGPDLHLEVGSRPQPGTTIGVTVDPEGWVSVGEAGSHDPAEQVEP